MGAKYKKRIGQLFVDDLKEIRNHLDPNDWGLFQAQLTKELNELDEKWEEISRKTDYPPLSTYGYRKRYMHSIPVRIKRQRNFADTTSDYRIVFKVDEEKQEIFYFGIGKRIKGLPKNSNDIWAILKSRQLPEEG